MTLMKSCLLLKLTGVLLLGPLSVCPAFFPRIRGFPVCIESSFLLSIQGRVLRVVYDENLDGGFRRYEFEPKLFLNKGEE
jgi:hypothetical protein